MTLLTELVPRTLDAVAVPGDDASAFIAARYRRTDPGYVRLNMITSVNGAAAGADGTSDTLTSRVDRSILGAIRDDADVVLVGAQSVRAEGYVLPRTALLAVVTRSGELGGHRLHVREHTGSEHTPPRRVLIVCPQGSPADINGVQLGPGIEPEVVAVPMASDGRSLAPAAIVAALASRGLGRIVCEGGPAVATQFVEAGLIDEFCLTVAPAVEAASTPLFAVSAAARPDTEVAGMLVDAAGFSYLRLRVRSASLARAATN